MHKAATAFRFVSPHAARVACLGQTSQETLAEVIAALQRISKILMYSEARASVPNTASGRADRTAKSPYVSRPPAGCVSGWKGLLQGHSRSSILWEQIQQHILLRQHTHRCRCYEAAWCKAECTCDACPMTAFKSRTEHSKLLSGSWTDGEGGSLLLRSLSQTGSTFLMPEDVRSASSHTLRFRKYCQCTGRVQAQVLQNLRVSYGTVQLA